MHAKAWDKVVEQSCAWLLRVSMSASVVEKSPTTSRYNISAWILSYEIGKMAAVPDDSASFARCQDWTRHGQHYAKLLGYTNATERNAVEHSRRALSSATRRPAIPRWCHPKAKGHPFFWLIFPFYWQKLFHEFQRLYLFFRSSVQ